MEERRVNPAYIRHLVMLCWALNTVDLDEVCMVWTGTTKMSGMRRDRGARGSTAQRYGPQRATVFVIRWHGLTPDSRRQLQNTTHTLSQTVREREGELEFQSGMNLLVEIFR